MNEMTPAERVALNTLRATALAKMSDADFANLEAEVARKGLRNLDGWFGAQVAKAVEQVIKHPGHANQAVHGGGKGGGSSSAPSSSGADSPAGSGNMEAFQNYLAETKKRRPRDSKDKAWKQGELQGYKEVKGMSKKDGIAHAKQLHQKTDKLNWNNSTPDDFFIEIGRTQGALSAVRALWGVPLSDVIKAVEPVVKHPGHADQSVHGGGRRKGGAPSSAPASSGGGTGGKFEAEPDDVGLGIPKLDANSRRKESEAADKVGYGANTAAENMGAHANELSQKVYGKDGASKRMTPTDGVELMGIQDSLASAAESLTMLSSPNRSGQEKQIARVKTQLKETRRDATTQLSPAVRGVTLQAIDKHIAEVDGLLAVHREAWTGVGGTFE
jgi:hypothetical protein